MRIGRSAAALLFLFSVGTSRPLSIIGLAMGVAPSAGRSDGTLNPPQSPRNANYVIDARLDPSTRTIIGSEIVTWRNITARRADELQFHLYWNGWRDQRSTWLREAALGGTTYDRRSHEWARIDVTSIA